MPARYSFDQWSQEYMLFGGNRYPLGYSTTYANQKAEPIGSDFTGYVQGILKADGVVAAVELVRLMVFAEARFQFQQLRAGRPGDLFGSGDLDILERPWTGGTTGDLLTRMLIDADFAGNSFTARIGDELVRLRPDWVEIILAERIAPFGPAGEDVQVGVEKVGYFYYEGGPGLKRTPAVFLPDEVAHFAWFPDPLATYRGMSWLTPVVREIQADKLATEHKKRWFENSATPNLSIALKDSLRDITTQQFKDFVEVMEERHGGVENAGRTLYTAGGADVTVIGSDMRQMDFKTVQGAGETRIAAAGRVHPVLAGLSEGMQGSSLNAGNYNSAKRSFADGTMRPLWRNVAGSLETLVPAPGGARLWYDDRDIAYLREDARDAAEIQATRAATIRQLVDAGYTPGSVIDAVESDDLKRLVHSGLYSVQLQPPGAQAPQPKPAA